MFFVVNTFIVILTIKGKIVVITTIKPIVFIFPNLFINFLIFLSLKGL